MNNPLQFDASKLSWHKSNGLIPVIVQHVANGKVLMLAYMNAEALQHTLDSGLVTFYSRSRQQLWQKGETSGNTLTLVDIQADCDLDTLLIQAQPAGPVCHLQTPTCFGDQAYPSHAFLGELQQLIQQRKTADPDNSYTAQLLSGSIHRAAQKVGEEGVETALAAVAEGTDELHNEAADLLYHLLVLLTKADTNLAAVCDVLDQRHQR